MHRQAARRQCSLSARDRGAASSLPEVPARSNRERKFTYGNNSMPQLLDLKQKRASHIRTMQNIVDKVKTEGRSTMTKAERDDHQGLMLKVNELTDTIEAIEATEGIARSLDETRSGIDSNGNRGAGSTPLMPGELRALGADERLADIIPGESRHAGFDMPKYLKGIVTGNWRGAEEERAVMTEGSLGNGGYTVPAQYAAQWIDLARNQTFTKKAGAKLVPMDSNSLRYPRQLSDPAMSWRGENVAISSNGLTFDAVTFQTKTLAAIVSMSVELFEDSAPQASQIVVNALTKGFAVEMDRVAFRGSAGNGEPVGIVNVAGTNSIANGTDGAVIANYDQLQDALADVATNNGNPENCAIVMSPRSFYKFGKLKDTQTNPLRIPSTLQNVPQYMTSIVPNNLTVGASTDCSQIVVGDWNESAFGVRTNLTIEATRVGSDGTNNAFSQLQVLIRGYLRCDFQVFRPNWFTVISGVR